MPAALRDVPTSAVELIKAFEGIPDGDPGTVNIDAYLCPAGVWTIGWGHALTVNGAQLKGRENLRQARAMYPGGITREQAELLLRADLIPRAAVVSRLCKVALDDGQFGALIALLFNIGEGNLGASTLLRKLNAGDFAGAAEQFLVWDKSRIDGVLQALPGLTRRRRAERAMFLGQDWRAAAAQGPVSRSRSAALAVLPVPEAPPGEGPAAAKRSAKKSAAKKGVAPRAPAQQAPAKKATAQKPPAKKAPGKQPGAKTSTAKQAPAKRSPAKKAAPLRRG